MGLQKKSLKKLKVEVDEYKRLSFQKRKSAENRWNQHLRQQTFFTQTLKFCKKILNTFF